MKKENKMPFGKVLLKTLKCLLTIADQWGIWLSYACLMSLISLAFRRWGYGCINSTSDFWCATNNGNITALVIVKYIFYYILTITAILAYLYDYYQSAFCNKNFTLKEIVTFRKAKIKSIGFLMLILFCFTAMGCAAYFLIRKPANHNFMIEFGYFLIVFTSFLVPLIAIRLASFISYYLQDARMPNLMKIYKDTTNHSFTPIILFFLSVMLSVILIIQSGIYLKALNLRFDNFATTFLSEIAGYAVILICYSIIMAIFRAQHEILAENDVSRETLVVTEKNVHIDEKETKKIKKGNKIKKNVVSKGVKNKKGGKKKKNFVTVAK